MSACLVRMNRAVRGGLALLFLLAAQSASAANVSCTPDPGFNACQRFTFSGAAQTFTVPAGVTSINVRMWAAGGGGFNSLYWPDVGGGGSGGFTKGTVAVNASANATLTVIVGGGGQHASTVATFGGGGAGGGGSVPGSSGGGLSGLFSGATPSQANALLIAGGGGGSSDGTDGTVNGPGGGGLSGGTGGSPTIAGSGGTQTAGGAAATTTANCGTTGTGPAAAGSALTGGKGADNAEGGGGGGGGYFGGGGGHCQNGPTQNGPGGGGSGFIGGTGVSGASTTAGNSGSIAQAVAPQNGDPQYVTGVGVGGGGVPAANALIHGGNGMVVIQFNTPTVKLRVGKSLPSGRVKPGDQFTLNILNGATTLASATTTGNTLAPSETASATATTGGTFTLSEADAGTADAASYLSSIACSNATAGSPTMLPSGSGTSFTVAAVLGDDISCTFTNTAARLVSGRVFLDNGKGGGTANDGIANGGEAPLAGVTVRLTDCAGVVYDTALTNGAGAYSLIVPAGIASGAALCVEEVNPSPRISTGASVGSTALPSGSATVVSGITYTYTRSGTPDRIAFTWSGIGHTNLNFGDVDNSTLVSSEAKSGLPGSTVNYAHTFTAGSAGSVVFSIASQTATPSASGWSAVVYADPGCTGTLPAGATPLSTGTAVNFAGTVCVIVQQFIPLTAPLGSSNMAVLQAAFSYTGANPTLSSTYQVEDITTVSNSALDLKKEVRNVTQGGSFGLNNNAKSGETLEYRITYTNNGSVPLNSLTVNDATPAYSSFVSATTGTTPATLSSCTKHTPANAAPAAAVACTTAQTAGGSGAIEWKFIGTLAPGGTGTVLFQVKVN